MSDYFISRDGQQMLVELLREIPGLVEDLSVTLTRQDRTGKGGMKISSGDCTQPLPINMAASDAKDGLHNELATWARLVCDSRGIAYDGDGSVLGIARWLDENVISLALTEGSEEAYVGIEKAMGRCRRAMDIAPEDEEKLDAEKLGESRNLELNARACAQVAMKLGCRKPDEDDELNVVVDFARLNTRRVLHLWQSGAVQEVRIAKAFGKESPIFQLGAVLDAHEDAVRREAVS